MKQSLESGRSMLEMLGVIGIVCVLSAGAIAAISFTSTYFKVIKMHTEVDEIANNILDLYSWSNGDTPITMTALCENDIFPDGCNPDNTAPNAFGGEVKVEGNSSNFEITYTKVGLRACELIIRESDKGNYAFVELVSGHQGCGIENDIVFGLK